MRTCSICGQQFADDLNQCPLCGNPVEPELPPVPTDVPGETVAGAPADVLPPVPPVPPDETGGGEVPPEVPSGPLMPPVPDEVPIAGGGLLLSTDDEVADAPVPRRSNTGLWIAIVAIVLLLGGGGAAWYFLSDSHSRRSSHSDDREESESAVEMEDYGSNDYAEYVGEPATDSLAVDEAVYDTMAVAPPAYEYETVAPAADEIAPDPQPKSSSIWVASGTLYLDSNSSTSCYVRLSFTIDSDNDVSGTAAFNGQSVSISGTYYPGSDRLLIYELNGGRYEGTWENGSYHGAYYDNGGSWSFNFNVK